MSTHIHSLLCLGDSYTIGENVALHENFPYQTHQLLRKNGFHFHAPEIIAKTGWTSLELAEHLINWKLNDNYDFVILLIGVNNQYRGLPKSDFATDFEFLLKKAIHLANHKPDHVIVLSIPDWTVTGFAANQKKNTSSKEIDLYNEVCLKIAQQYHTGYIEITAFSRLAQKDESLLAGDQLHYSPTAYGVWAEKIYKAISSQIH
jgi:lysophospholipase L1-like esterase